MMARVRYKVRIIITRTCTCFLVDSQDNKDGVQKKNQRRIKPAIPYGMTHKRIQYFEEFMKYEHKISPVLPKTFEIKYTFINSFLPKMSHHDPR